MNHKEALLQLSDDQLYKILKNLKNTRFKKDTMTWIAEKIAEFYQAKKMFRHNIPSIGEETINDLYLYAHVNKPLNDEQVQLLNDYGILVKGELTEDLRERLVKWSRPMFVKMFPHKREEAKHSLFLQCILLLHYFEREKSVKLNPRKNARNVRLLAEELFMDKATIWKAINALVVSGLVLKTKDLYELNIPKFTKWKNKPIDTVLKSFYEQQQTRSQVSLFLDKISKYQQIPEEWVDSTVILNTSIEFDQARQLGLIQVYKELGKTYVQLLPEGWYITKNQTHPLWNQKVILISPSFEIFIPYHYDPFKLFELLPICTMKDSDYFLVFDIDMDFAKKSKKAIEEFHNTLEGCSPAIPQVVEYELKAAIDR